MASPHGVALCVLMHIFARPADSGLELFPPAGRIPLFCFLLRQTQKARNGVLLCRMSCLLFYFIFTMLLFTPIAV